MRCSQGAGKVVAAGIGRLPRGSLRISSHVCAAWPAGGLCCARSRDNPFPLCLLGAGGRVVRVHGWRGSGACSGGAGTFAPIFPAACPGGGVSCPGLRDTCILVSLAPGGGRVTLGVVAAAAGFPMEPVHLLPFLPMVCPGGGPCCP